MSVIFQTRPAMLPCFPSPAPSPVPNGADSTPLQFTLTTTKRKRSCTFSLQRSTRTRPPAFSASPHLAAPAACASLTLAKPLPAHAYYPPTDDDDTHDQTAGPRTPAPADAPAHTAQQRPAPRLHSRTPDTSDPITCLKLLIAGASSALVSRTVVAPLERVKMELVLNSCGRGPLDTALHVLQHEGVRGFWKGNALNILRTAPFKALNFLCFDLYHNLFTALAGHQSNTQRFAAGAAAGITATLLCFPLDVLRTRILTPQGRRYGGPLRTLTGIFKYEGRAALYAGVLPAVIAMAPAGAVFYGVYDLLKQQYLAKQAALLGPSAPLPDHLPAVYTLLYGAAAGAASEITVYPLEVIRRRMQVLSAQHASAAGVARGSAALVMATSAVAESGAAASPAALAVQRLAQATAGIVRAQGVAGLYSGLVPNMLQVLPSAALSYFTFETVKSLLQVVKESS